MKARILAIVLIGIISVPAVSAVLITIIPPTAVFVFTPDYEWVWQGDTLVQRRELRIETCSADWIVWSWADDYVEAQCKSGPWIRCDVEDLGQIDYQNGNWPLDDQTFLPRSGARVYEIECQSEPEQTAIFRDGMEDRIPELAGVAFGQEEA